MTSARVIIASTRAAAGVYEDRTGPLIVSWLTERGITEIVDFLDSIRVGSLLFVPIGAGPEALGNLVLTRPPGAPAFSTLSRNSTSRPRATCRLVASGSMAAS